MTFVIKPHQIEQKRIVLDRLCTSQPGRWLVQSPTGTGKTVTAASIIKEIIPQRFLWLAHREELIDQARKTILNICNLQEEQVDRVLQSQPNQLAMGWIASVATLVRGERLTKIKPDVIFIDEAHHSIASSYTKIIEAFPNTHVVGFTATPSRSSAKEKKILANFWGDLIYQLPLKKAIQQGILAEIEYYRLETGVDISKVRSLLGDFSSSELEEKINIEPRNHEIVEKYLELGGGKAICFSCNIAHCVKLAETFSEMGVPANYVHQGTKPKEREEILENFYATGMTENHVLVNVAILTEGYDCPNILKVIMARPHRSEVPYLQEIGRGTRTFTGKKACQIIDVVDNAGNKDLCGVLTTVFHLSPGRIFEGNVLEKIENGNEEKQDKSAFSSSKNKITSIKDAKMIQVALFECPIDLSKSGLAWTACADDQYVVQIDKGCFLRIVDGMLNYKLFRESTLILASSNIQEILSTAKKMAEEHPNNRFMWNSKYIERLKGQPASPAQKSLVEKIIPGIDISGMTKYEASKLISARLARKFEPATQAQINYLSIMGYEDEKLICLSKTQASKEIARLKELKKYRENHPTTYKEEEIPF